MTTQTTKNSEDKTMNNINNNRFKKFEFVSFTFLAALFGSSSFEPKTLYRFSFDLSTFQDSPERN